MSELIPPSAQQIQIPLAVFQNVQLRIDTFPDGSRMLTIGPVAIGVPLTEQTEKWLTENLQAAGSGLVIAKPTDLTKL